MKFLIPILCFLLFFTIPSCALSDKPLENKVTEEWKEGDIVAAFVVCQTEQDIIDISNADTLGAPELINKIIEKKILRQCIQFSPPVPFIVVEILGHYLDHKKINTSIMKIKSKNHHHLIGYIIVEGIPGKSKGI